MRQNLVQNLRMLGNRAFGLVCSFAPAYLPDRDYLYENIGENCGRLRC